MTQKTKHDRLARVAPADPENPKTAKRPSTDALPARTWQQRKSELTQQRILQATIDTIYELGYNLTTTDKVAVKAGVSRGAMLHHFPVRRDLIQAAVKYLNEQRLEEFLAGESAIQGGSNRSRIGAGIDVYWGQVSSPLAVVFQELKVLSRTDAELRAVLSENAADFEQAWNATVERVFPDLIMSAQHEVANLLTRNLCEGMALNRSMVNDPELTKKVLDELKNYLRRSYQDVRDGGSRKNRHQ